MQGVLGVKAYIPRSEEVRRFSKRWSKRFHKENPEMDRTELNVIGLWSYDSVTALAEAVERVGVASPRFKKPVQRWNLTDLEAIGTSNSDPSFVDFIRNYKFKGLSGDFHIINGQLQPSVFEIVNVIGKGDNTVGFWTEKYGISKELNPNAHELVSSTERDNLQGILWPGQTSNVPKGWEIPIIGKKLRVGVPVKKGFTEFIKKYDAVDCDPPIMHRDIKPMNILLDSEMEAHISDFGIAKLLDESVSSTQVAVEGTTGYIAPENAFSTSSRESDVYAYGVVLLELVMRKRVLDASFGEGMDIVGWARGVWDEGRGVGEIPMLWMSSWIRA